MRAIGMRIIGVVAFLLTMASMVSAWQVKLAWDAPTTNTDGTPATDLAGYDLFYRRPTLGETTYVAYTNIGNATSFQMINLDAGTEYCFVVTAYNTSGAQSGDSNEVCTTQPVTLFVQPLNGDTVAGTELVSIHVADSVYPNGANSVMLDIHNTGIWTPVSYNPATGLYEINWNTAGYGTTTPETVQLSTIAANPDQIASDPNIITVTVDNRPPLHIGDLKNISTSGGGSKWTARVQAMVHDAGHIVVAGATVTGAWQGITGVASCTTDATGTCSVAAFIPKGTKSIVFSVTGIQKSGSAYQAFANHDPDGDSNGTTIIVARP